MARSIEEYRAAQDAMEALRARHVGDAFKEAAGDAFTPAQLSALMADLDLAKFVGPDGQVDKTRVTKLLKQLGGKPGPSDKRGPVGGKGGVADHIAARQAARDAKAVKA